MSTVKVENYSNAPIHVAAAFNHFNGDLIARAGGQLRRTTSKPSRRLMPRICTSECKRTIPARSRSTTSIPSWTGRSASALHALEGTG